MFKTELHVHTFPASNCARTCPEDMVENFIENGYSTVVITNHFSPTLFNVVAKDKSYKEAVDLFLSNYHRAIKQADGRLNVLLGMEFRNIHNDNDYLVYGIDEQLLYRAEGILNMKIKNAYEYLTLKGAMVFQAHPFRDGMTVTNPKYLDGIEEINFCVTHNNRNDMAKLWADSYGLLRVYGQDYHSVKYMQGAGILTDTEIKTNEQLLEVLRAQSFKVTDGKEIIR
ncbi:MAG: PHP domain-containing protein [Clostridia bacterium]|nr:PHP domain-containing protein [Clostridia bacterium]